jgi:type VI protein secretion system component VasK
MKFLSQLTYHEILEFSLATTVLVIAWLFKTIFKEVGIAQTIYHYVLYILLLVLLFCFINTIKQNARLEKNEKQMEVAESRLNAHDDQIKTMKGHLNRLELRSQMELNSRVNTVVTP